MKTFRQFLTEDDSQFFKTKEEIQEWLNKWFDHDKFKINEDLTVDCNKQTLTLREVCIAENDYKLPVRFKNSFSVTLSTDKFKNLAGIPTNISGWFNTIRFLGGGKIKTIEGLRTRIVKAHTESGCYLNSFDITLSNIHKYVLETPKIAIPSDLGPSPILGLLLIKNLESIICVSELDSTTAALSIVRRHIKMDRDLLDCQEDLIKFGLKEYAKI